MRPIAGDDAFPGRSRSTSFTDNATTPVPGPNQPPQMTYFLTDEKTLESSTNRPILSHTRSRECMKRSNFGVQSLDTTTSSLASDDNNERSRSLEKARDNWKKGLAKGFVARAEEHITRSRSPSPRSSAYGSRDISPSESRRSVKSASRPFTPTNLESPFLGSVKSSPSSRRNSEVDFLMDDAASQAIVSSGGEEEKEMPSEITDNSSASQLVMPSIRMPSRRPFTEKGKNMGRLKVLIAGDSGTFVRASLLIEYANIV
jgi:hypothetical protein